MELLTLLGLLVAVFLIVFWDRDYYPQDMTDIDEDSDDENL